MTFKDDVRKFKPYAFTEHGVLMLANVLRSKKATAISIRIVEAFIKLRDYALTHVEFNGQISELRQLLLLHIDKTDHKFSEHEQTIQQIIQVLNSFLEQPRKTKKIGFHTYRLEQFENWSGVFRSRWSLLGWHCASKPILVLLELKHEIDLAYFYRFVVKSRFL